MFISRNEFWVRILNENKVAILNPDIQTYSETNESKTWSVKSYARERGRVLFSAPRPCVQSSRETLVDISLPHSSSPVPYRPPRGLSTY